MSSETTAKLTRLLTTFDALRLGEGDASAGANVLAAMACAIANVHRHGTRIASEDGASFQTGCSLLAYGPLTAALVCERVTGVLAELQSNVSSHHKEWNTAMQEYGKSKPPGAPLDERFTVDPDIRSLCVLKDETVDIPPTLASLLTPMRRGLKRALLDQPLVFATGASPAKLGASLERSHNSQLLVHDVLRDPAQCTTLTDCCLPLLDGCLTVGPLSTPVCGHLLLRDPSRVLDEVLRDGGHGRRLLLRLPWLVDGNIEPTLPVAEISAANHPRLDRMEKRFRVALSEAWIRRLDYTADETQNMDFDLTSIQSRWIRFLQQQEAHFPGISAAARPLLATLLFGLLEMLYSLPNEEDVELHAEDVLALGCLLVQRMGNTRAVIMFDGEKERKEHKLQLMLDKLGEGISSPRELVRRFHRLPTDEGRDLLNELVARGKAIDLGDDRYQRVPAARHQMSTLTLEV
jgi:hypothetical protein